MPSFEDLIKFVVPTVIGAAIALTAPFINLANAENVNTCCLVS